MVWSPDGTRLASASDDRTVRVWDPDGHTDPTVLTGHDNWVWAVVWSPDGTRLASASHDGTLRVWELEYGTAQGLAIDGDLRVTVWSPDGRFLALGGSKGLYVLDSPNSNRAATPEVPTSRTRQPTHPAATTSPE